MLKDHLLECFAHILNFGKVFANLWVNESFSPHLSWR